MTANLTSPPNSVDNASNVPPTVDIEHDKLFRFDDARAYIDNLIKDWEPEIRATERRRKQRSIEVDVEVLHQKGRLKSDETLIPIRVIDSAIRKELPNTMSYVTQSRRLAIFECLDDPLQDTNNLEVSFTKGMKYLGWEIPFLKTADGAAMHGWDSMEVEFKSDRPLTVNLDHVGHENLIFPRDSKDIQGSERILRRYELTKLKLRNFQQKFGFSKEQIDLITAKQEGERTEKNIEVFKIMFKYEGLVYVGWYARDGATDWLKAPAPLYLGVDRKITTTVPMPQLMPSPMASLGVPPTTVMVPQIQISWEPVYESLYPYKVLKYAETEQDSITEYKGRCYLDGPKQEAQTALWSIFINGSVRAGNVYGSPKSPSGTGAPLKKIDLALEHGCFYSEPIEFWHTDFPDASLVRAAEALDSQSQAESGQLAAAVVNRDDSRKTAKEIETATSLTSLLSSVQVTLFSIFLREVFCHSWLIVQSQARQELIDFCLIQMQSVDVMGQPSMEYKNDVPTIEKSYDLRAAGDIDVVERAEKLQKRGQLWAMVSQTPLAMDFLIDILKEALPEDAARYERILMTAMQQANQQQQMIGALGGVLKEVVTGDDGQVKPEYKQHEQQLQQLAQQTQQVMAQKGGGAGEKQNEQGN